MKKEKKISKDFKEVIFISSITSDIGIALAERYHAEGHTVAGTYRSTNLLHKLEFIPKERLFYCDLGDKATINDSVSGLNNLELEWTTFISCASSPAPLNSFFDSVFDKWSQSVHLNAIEQLRVLHGCFESRNKDICSNVFFFAGPGTNNAVTNFSALTVSKILLIKMCELLDAENFDLNTFIIGPGWTKSKTHEVIMSDPDVSPDKYAETLSFIENEEGTSMDDIYACFRSLTNHKKSCASGRNFSVVHDYWNSTELFKELEIDVSMYKLRRFKNNWKDKDVKK